MATKETERVEITRLSKLISIEAWRGLIVDRIISEEIVGKLRKRQKVHLTEYLTLAKTIFDKQSEELLTKKEPYKSLEWVDKDYNKIILPETIQQAWLDIELALTNFFDNKQLLDDKEIKKTKILTVSLGSYMVVKMFDKRVNTGKCMQILIRWQIHQKQFQA
jgi:hypothetical protein